MNKNYPLILFPVVLIIKKKRIKYTGKAFNEAQPVLQSLGTNIGVVQRLLK